MKKTIKYGGVALGAVAAMGGGSVFAAGVPVAIASEADCTVTMGEKEDTTSSTSLTEQAGYYNNSATCYADKATAASNSIVMPAIASGVYAKDDNNKTDVTATAGKATEALATLKEKYGVESFGDEELTAALKVAEEGKDSPWVRMDNATGNVYNEAKILAEIKTVAQNDDEYSDAKAIINDFKKGNWLKGILDDAGKYADFTAKAEAAKAEANRLTEAATAAKTAEDAKDESDKKQTALKNATEAADDAIKAAKEAGASDEEVKALEDALEAAKNGEDVDLSELVAKANEAQVKAEAATKAAEDADQAAKDAASKRGFAVMDEIVKKSAVTTAKNDLNQAKQDLAAAESALETATREYEEAVGTENEVTKKAAMNNAKEAVKDAKEAVTEKETALATAEKAYADAQQALIDATQVKADADVALANANKAKDDAVKAAAETAALAQAIEGAADKVENVSDVAKVAKKYAEKAEAAAKDAAKARGETPEEPGTTDPTDPTGPTDPEEPGTDEPGTTDPEEPGTTDPEEPGTDEPGTTEDVDTDGKPYDYSVLSGDGKVWTTDGETLSFRFKAPFALFDYIVLDGEPVGIDTGLYSVKEGSTIITLSKELLDSLSEDEHTLAAVFTNGEISEVANFTIKAAEVEVKAPETGVYTAETSAAISSFVTAFMAATIAGAAVVIRKRA